MLRKILVPFFYFLFGISVFYLESEFGGEYKALKITCEQMNRINPWIFSGSFLIVMFFEVRPQYKKITTQRNKYSYLIGMTIILGLIALFWINIIEWK